MPRSRSACASRGLVICSERRSTPPSCSDTRRILVGDRVGVAHEEGAVGAAGRVELRPATGGAKPRSRDTFANISCQPGIDRVGCCLRALGDEPEHVQAHLQRLGRVPGLRARPAVEVDQRRELAGLAADDRHHQRQAEQAGADEGLRRAADADPDRQRVLQRAGVDALPGQRRPVPAATR